MRFVAWSYGSSKFTSHISERLGIFYPTSMAFDSDNPVLIFTLEKMQSQHILIFPSVMRIILYLYVDFSFWFSYMYIW